MLHNCACNKGIALRNNKQSLRAIKPATGSRVGPAFVPPFLRWAGSKRQLLPELGSYWHSEYGRYVEPFAGSACLFFSLAPKKALLGDINGHLVGTLQTVRDDVESIIPLLANARRDKDLYYHIRSIEPDRLASAERAAQFIYLNRYCFNGLYRTNLKGHFNVPFGADRTGDIPTPEHLRHCSLLLKGAKLVAGDFERTLSEVRKGDFVYMDPPYVTGQRRVFREYDSSAFTSLDIERLRRHLDRLSDEGIPFLVSYADCDEARYLAKGFKVKRKLVRRSIAGFAGNRGQRRELLISNA